MFHSDKSRSFLARSARYVAAPTLLPPKLSEFGHQPFSSLEQESLARWLQEPAWPRGTLDVYALEGYLTALLVWPVALQPGAWLPPIWNETGWRVPAPIDTVQRYAEFVELVIGFLRTIDHGLLQTPPTFEPGQRLQFGHHGVDVKVCAQNWSQGFGRGLAQGVEMRVVPTVEAREAVHTIAAPAAGQSSFAKSDTRDGHVILTHAVLVLANTRVSRGPLGGLPKHTTAKKRPGPEPQPQPHEMVGQPADGSAT
jgi:yecA family protein